MAKRERGNGGEEKEINKKSKSEEVQGGGKQRGRKMRDGGRQVGGGKGGIKTMKLCHAHGPAPRDECHHDVPRTWTNEDFYKRN